MFRIKLRVERVPIHLGLQAAVDITGGFTQRPWHKQAACMYEDGGITFIAENDFDENGLATLDEFSDEFSANVPIYEENDGNLTIVSIEQI